MQGGLSGGHAETASRKYDIPIAVHLDHFETFDEIKKYLDMGIKSCMIDASHHSFEENVRIVKQIVNYAHSLDVSVEAELGRLGGVEDDLVVDERMQNIPILSRPSYLSSSPKLIHWQSPSARLMAFIKVNRKLISSV